MSLLDKLTAGAERAAKEAEKAFDKGKAKVGELQLEMQMDGSAKKLGYLVFDFYRGRQVDQAQRQALLDEMTRLEDQMMQARAEAAAKAQAQAGTAAAPDTGWQPGAARPEDATPSWSSAPAGTSVDENWDAVSRSGTESATSGYNAPPEPATHEQHRSEPPAGEEPWPQADA